MTTAILAGGNSSRIGQDKAFIPFLGQPLIQRVIQNVTPVSGEILVITRSIENNLPLEVTFPGLRCISDRLPGKGALGGIYTALSAACNPYVVVVACDMPFVNPKLLLRELELLARWDADVVIPQTPDGLEPLHAVYRCRTCLPAVEQALRAGQQRLISWFPQVKVHIMRSSKIAVLDPDFRSFININTPEDLRLAEQLVVQNKVK